MKMSYKLTKGKFDIKGLGGFSSAFGGLDLELEQKMEDTTLKQLAERLAKHYDVKEGEVELYTIVFNYRKRD